MSMELLKPSFLNTTTMLSCTTGTASSSNLFSRTSDSYQSSGDNSDLTTTTIRIELSASQNLDRLALEGINLKSFQIYHSSNTANKLTLSNALTTTSEWSTNSETALYLQFTTITASIITIEATATMIANAEKQIQECWILQKQMSFVNDPSARQYTPKLKRKEYKHEMSDGGTATYVIQNNADIVIRRTYVDTTEYDDLWDVYNLYTPIGFVPEPTGTSWNGQIWEVNWIGDFEFLRYQKDFKSLGYRGKLKLKETPK